MITQVMLARPRTVVTGAFSYTGSAVAAELLRRGHSVFTLTNRTPPPRSPFSSAALRFEPEHLRRALAGANALVNTYWQRYPFAGADFVAGI